WHRRNFLLLLDDSLRQLCCCPKEKHLLHLLSKKRVPEKMVLCLAFCIASLLNLSQCLTQELAAHAQALDEFKELRDCPTRLPISTC
ncbi:unnamed protein product, partial [Bubo scandiacus]